MTVAAQVESYRQVPKILWPNHPHQNPDWADLYPIDEDAEHDDDEPDFGPGWKSPRLCAKIYCSLQMLVCISTVWRVLHAAV